MDISSKFTQTFQELVNNNHITKKMILNHREANRSNLHSKLIYVLVKAFEHNNLIAFSEIKRKLKDPINPNNFGVVKEKKIRKQWQYKCDVAAFDKNELVSLCEVFTMDMISHHLPSKVLKTYYPETNWVTSADKINILFNKENLKKPVHFYIVSVLPERAEVLPSWADVKKLLNASIDSRNTYNIIEPHLTKLLLGLKPLCRTTNKIVITENGIWYNGDFRLISYKG